MYSTEVAYPIIGIWSGSPLVNTGPFENIANKINFVMLVDMSISNSYGHNLIIERYVQLPYGTAHGIHALKCYKMGGKSDLRPCI